METQLALVTFEQAKRLKKLGFDWKCQCYYIEDENKYEIIDVIEIKGVGIYGFDLFETNHNEKETRFSAPTVALALKWFRDVKNIRNSVSIDWLNYKMAVAVNGCIEKRNFTTYEQAESALLNELLKIVE